MKDSPTPSIREATPADAAAIARIYNHYVAHSIATFEETPVSGEEIAHRMQAVRDASLPWLVAELDGSVAGYAYASPWKTRVGYRFSVETSVYLDPALPGRGIGTGLYAALFARLEARGIRNAVGGIALPNDASVALHEKFGMRKVAHFPRIGIKFGRWIDVGYWQREFGDDV